VSDLLSGQACISPDHSLTRWVGALDCVEVQWTVQINSILEFMDNLMGARESLSIAELQNLLTPMFQ
jgi:hypothetical protein